MPKTHQFLRELADREAIRDCLYRYSRGVDRCDAETLRSVYWEDAVDDHILFTGKREELIAWVIPLLQSMSQSQHIIGNILIRLHGERADAESYFYGYHRVPKDGAYHDAISCGRYLDTFECRDGEWRILKRKVITDWYRDYPDSGSWENGGPQGHSIKPGGRFPDDPSYALLDFK